MYPVTGSETSQGQQQKGDRHRIGRTGNTLYQRGAEALPCNAVVNSAAIVVLQEAYPLVCHRGGKTNALLPEVGLVP